MSVLNFIILSLAVTRLAFLFVEEEGPYHIFEKLREKFDVFRVEFIDDCGNTYFGPIELDDNNLIGNILSCRWCFSIWASGFLLLFYYLLPTATIIFSTWLAISAVSMMIGKIIDV